MLIHLLKSSSFYTYLQTLKIQIKFEFSEENLKDFISKWNWKQTSMVTKVEIMFEDVIYPNLIKDIGIAVRGLPLKVSGWGDLLMISAIITNK